MHLRRTLGLAFLGLILTTGPALAAHRAEHDITLNLTVAPSLLQPSGATGSGTYAAQEGAHQAVTHGTGQSVDHYYLWLYLNGQPVAAIDPLWVSGRQPDGN